MEAEAGSHKDSLLPDKIPLKISVEEIRSIESVQVVRGHLLTYSQTSNYQEETRFA